ncbi:MAG: thymidylate synthase [Flavobacteriaceae bacterium]|nr:thymidylate synthase [Flavobacteriaceae bacterium]
MPVIIESNIHKAWVSILKKIQEEGRTVVDENKNKTREILNLFAAIENPLDEENLDKFFLTMNQINVFTKLLLDEKEADEAGFIPGKRLYDFFGYKQWEKVCDRLIDRPMTRRASIILCEPSRDFEGKRPPSLLLIDFKIRDNKLNLTAVIRSNDMFRVWPANAYSLAKLLEKTVGRLRDKIQVEPGILNILSMSAHIYEDDYGKINRIIST